MNNLRLLVGCFFILLKKYQKIKKNSKILLTFHLVEAVKLLYRHRKRGDFSENQTGRGISWYHSKEYQVL